MDRIRPFSSVVLAVALVSLAGCGHISEAYIVDASVVDTSTEPVNGREAPPAFDLDQEKFPGSTSKLSAYQETVQATGGVQTALRNRLQTLLLTRADKICRIHKGRILANASTFDFGTGLTAAILSTASAAVGGETAKTILSAGSAVATATGTAIRASFYQDILASAVVGEIERLQKIELDRIEKSRVKMATAYTPDDAIRDVVLYHFKCSFYEGLISLAKDKTAKAKTKQELTGEINALLKENEGLAKAVEAAGTEELKNRLRETMEANALEIRRLSLVRVSAPGTMTP